MKKKINWSNVILVMIFLLGLSLLLYPTISDYWNSFHQSRVIASYSENVANMDNEIYQQQVSAAKAFNKKLLKKKYQWTLNDEEKEAYYSILNITDTGIMGYIEIPSLNSTLPIYHGAGEDVLQVAIGHIEGSSFPIGGKSTHCVVSGHRGLPSAKLFSDLDKMVEGDIFMLHILDETLTYEVDQIHIVLPEEVKDIEIIEGKDLCTLVTCTPYGINSHRLLVRGKRVDNPEYIQAQRVAADAVLVDDFYVACAIGIGITLVLIIWLFIYSWVRRLKPKLERKRENYEETHQ